MIVITNVVKKALCSTSSKNLFFSKSGIPNRSYGSLKQSLRTPTFCGPLPVLLRTTGGSYVPVPEIFDCMNLKSQNNTADVLTAPSDTYYCS